MRCRECHQIAREGSSFCEYCGRPLITSRTPLGRARLALLMVPLIAVGAWLLMQRMRDPQAKREGAAQREPVTLKDAPPKSEPRPQAITTPQPPRTPIESTPSLGGEWRVQDPPEWSGARLKLQREQDHWSGAFEPRPNEQPTIEGITSIQMRLTLRESSGGFAGELTALGEDNAPAWSAPVPARASLSAGELILELSWPEQGQRLQLKRTSGAPQ